MAISMLKIRRPLGRLIFNMGIAIPGKTVFLIETAPMWRPIIWINIASDRGLSLLRCQAIAYTKAHLLSIGVLGKIVSEIWIRKILF